MTESGQFKESHAVTNMNRAAKFLGFKQTYNFVLFLNFAGALMGFTLARLMYLNFDDILCGPGFSTTKRALPGECYYYRTLTLDRIGIMMHLGCILPASFLACWQFIPVIRHKMILFHRINGYVVLVLATPGTVGALLIARHAVGGGLEVQASVGFLCIVFLASLFTAFVYIKRLQIDQHRAWMLRAWFYAGAIVTIRPIMMIAALIVSRQGGYYVTIPCAVIEFMMGQANAANATSSLFEDCIPYASGENPNQQAVVEANFFDKSTPAGPTASLHVSFGMAGWLAGAIHAIGVEVYLRLTPGESERLRKLSCQKQLEAGLHEVSSIEVTSNRLEDVEKVKAEGV
ncbi:hypothetical protein CI238_00838 [Colletotrichum incanum]|uniref:Uncharacterized protein n=1 Tax=Colletotrichum incanum TaxID=1573173 RepID=A0A166TGG8_COLIC|nr:hypothetical protein CI238_00838 [Colletotrichum incanum]OHW99583.1 hypothetical protein CSPAE12_01736 [Colletotrichum incanum]